MIKDIQNQDHTMLNQGDFVTAVIGSPDTKRIIHGTILSEPLFTTWENNQAINKQEPFIAIQQWWCKGDKVIFAHIDDTIKGHYTN